MVQRAVVVVVVIFSAYVVAQPGQTFQSTVFDIPAELPSEDYAVLSQLDDAPTQKVQDPLKPKKINKAALNLPQVQPTLPTVPQPPPVQPLQPPPQPATPAPFTLPTHPAFPTFTFPTHPPFTLPTHPTIAPFTLPGAPTPPPPPFVLPTHPTMAPFTFPTHPTFAPFTFPTHPTFAPYTAAPPPFGPQSSQEPLQPQTGQAPQPNQGFQQIGTQAQVPQTPTVQPQFSGLPQQPNQPQVQQPPQHPLFPPHHQFPQPTGQQQQQQYGQLQQPQFGQQQQFQQTQQVQQPQFGQQQQFQQTQQVQQQQIQNQQQQQFGAQYPPQQQVPPAQYHHTFGESQFSQQGQLQGQNQNQQQQVQQQQVSQQPFFHQHQLPQHPLFQQQGLPQQQGPPQQQQQQPNQGNQPQQVFPQQQFQQHQHFPQQQGVQQSQLSRQQLLQRTEGPQHRPIVQPPPQQQQLQLQQSIDARPQQFTKPVSTNQQQGVPQRRFEQVVVAGAPVTVAPQPLPLPSPQLPPILSPLNLQVQEGAALVQPVLPGENAEALDGGQVEKVSSSTPNRGTLWFKDDFDISACQKNLSAIAEKFSAKFPLYLQKTGKDIALAGLVQQRLIECERKQTATHWDKVDGLLAKIALSKSEESECRGGLVQERISCVNLINYACQFIDPTFIFRLVPARITIQEARQAEAGAEKCRKVVRLVKKRLEG